MKKLLAFSLAALVLAGCTPEPPAPTDPTIVETTPATEEFVIDYDAVEILEFDYEGVYAAAPMGDDLLLFCNQDRTTLVKISGRNHKELAATDTGSPISPDFRAVQVCENGICYAAGQEYIFLNENLEEVERITLPNAWGTGAISADLQSIYYSTGSQLWIYNRETGLDRLLRETMHTGLVLDSLQLNDSILVCQLFDHHAVSPTLFYSAATGELLDTYEASIALTSAGDTWLAKTSDGRQNQIVCGGIGDPVALSGWEAFSDVTLVEGGILIKTPMEDSAAIRFADPTNGTEAAVALEDYGYITNAWNAGGILWIALDDGRLLRWELEDTETQAAACIAPYYSRENPDTERLAALESVIADLETAYGVSIHIYEDALTDQPAGMTLGCEYQVDTLTAALEELKLALGRFSPEFLAKCGKASDDGKIHICLVRSVSSESCIQFWDENGNARIAVTADGDLQKSFFHGLGHIMDARVLTKTTAFDGWKNLNPKGFGYSYDPTAEADGDAFPGAFADDAGMVSPVEDRASVFAAAMLADQQSTFESETMQKKLSALCTGIRRAFGLKDAEEIFPWEQYLAE